ncbi:MAG: chromosomal replication initiator protein DnaA [Lachnospiraceae bacterium]|nr:chromosomal replication initiator protein DnaA [Lachnospiraceae bacterium]
MKEKLLANWEEIKNTCREEFDISSVSYEIFIYPLDILDVKDHTIMIYFNTNKKKNFVGTVTLDRKARPSLSAIIPLYLDQSEDYEIVFYSPEEAEEYLNGPKTAALSQENQKPVSSAKNSNLNPRYTFDTFVVGNNNSMAHAAALAVAEAPGEFYNPLYIYGGVGLGKTHLMHAIAHYAMEQHERKQADLPEKDRVPFNVMYVTSEVFTNELIEAIRGGKSDIATAEFRNKYRNVDMLLIDDIQFIIGKDRTQEEFFHTFNSLFGKNRQMIISSDKPPREFAQIEERLLSRFEMGLTVDIQMPDYETRMAILRNKAEADHLRLDDKIFDYIATNIKSNIRELEGALNKINVYSRLKHVEITPELAEEALKDLISPNENGVAITPELIMKIVSDYYGITVEDLLSTKKSRDISVPRQITMYLIRAYTHEKYDQIGMLLGGRDHTTVISGVRKIEEDMRNDPTTANTVEALSKRIKPE